MYHGPIKPAECRLLVSRAELVCSFNQGSARRPLRPQLLIGMAIGRELGLDVATVGDLRYAILLNGALDGAGYPPGLFDAQIGLETRIITVCDISIALTSDRPCRACLDALCRVITA